jgi:glycosyltransferase involved in cell wall biosynthesis
MNGKVTPLVSVLTPVYNNGDRLAECIESVLAQTHANWDYTIVDNCSTDDSFEVAQRYAAKDPRIRVLRNNQFLKIIPNHNHTIRQISPESEYCKFVFADDWIFPRCLEQMVAAAEAYPSVGLVCCYAMDGRQVLWTGLPFPSRFIPGREMARQKLLGEPFVFGTGTSQMIRADLARKRPVFFNESNLHADAEVCLDLLQECDFSFVHEILSFSRPPETGQSTSFAKEFDSHSLGNLVIFIKYGKAYLSEDEYRQGLHRRLSDYYRKLAKNVLRMRSNDFWEYHKSTLAAFNQEIRPAVLAKYVLRELLWLMRHPVVGGADTLSWWRREFGRIH